MALPFFTAPYGGWIALISFVPFLYAIIHYRFLWIDFLCWSLAGNSLMLLPIAQIIYEHATGNIRLGVWFFLIGYLSILQTGVMVLAEWATRFYANRQTLIIFFFCSALSIYSYWLYRFSLLIFGLDSGLPFCSFLVPLFCCATPHFPLTITGAGGLIVFLIFIQGLLSLLFVQKKYYRLLIMMFLLTMIIYVPHRDEKMPKWLENVAALNRSHMPHTNDPWERADDILHQLECIKKRKATVALIIAPESTFTWPLNRFSCFINRWSTYGLDEKTAFIMGTQRTENEKLYNSAVLLQQGRITQIYDKRIPLIFTERQPRYCNFTNLCTFFTTKNGTCQGQSIGAPFNIENSTIPPLAPLICSELFFAYQKPVDCRVAICLINDSWFSTAAPRHLLCALARLNALMWNVDVLYISHHFQLFISSNGQKYELSRSAF